MCRTSPNRERISPRGENRNASGQTKKWPTLFHRELQICSFSFSSFFSQVVILLLCRVFLGPSLNDPFPSPSPFPYQEPSPFLVSFSASQYWLHLLFLSFTPKDSSLEVRVKPYQ
mmetsp:Transcript_29239/g.40395  ORF Transcript_29239/g.40395 Transcript_29239/m.40395 type:complete len:115 (-) Transcript_29239:375-719(-)